MDTEREFRLQMANAGQDTVGFESTEFGVVSGKLDQFFQLRERRLLSTRAANVRHLIQREFGALLDNPSTTSKHQL